MEEVPVLGGRLEGRQYSSALCHLVLSLCYRSAPSTAAFEQQSKISENLSGHPETLGYDSVPGRKEEFKVCLN